MNKKINILIFYLSFFILIPYNTFANKWIKDENKNWRYQKNDGTYETNSIKNSGLDKFYLNDEGYIEKNFFLQDYNNNSYYFGPTGAMLKDTKVQITINTKSNKKIFNPMIIVLNSQGRVIKETNNVNDEIIKNNIVLEEGEIVDIYEDDVKILKNGYKLYEIGDTISFGEFNIKYNDGYETREKINWTIVSKSNGLLLVSQMLFDNLGYNCKWKTNDYKNSKFRDFIINEFYNNAFTEVEKRIIKKNIGEQDFVTILDEKQYNKYIVKNESFNNMTHLALYIDIN